MKKVIKRIVNIVIDIIVILILAVSVLIVTLSLTSKSSGVPNIFGIAPLSVLTGSMEDTINTGDLIFCEVTDDPSYEYKKGDIVTFYKNINGNSELNTHRIVEVVKDDNITYYLSLIHISEPTRLRRISILTELLRLLRMTTLPTTELRVTIRKLTRSPMKNFKLLHLLSPNTQVRRLAAWVTF